MPRRNRRPQPPRMRTRQAVPSTRSAKHIEALAADLVEKGRRTPAILTQPTEPGSQESS